MKFKSKIQLSLFLALFISWHSLAAKMLDKVSVIVDQGVILESEIQYMLKDLKKGAAKNNQTLPSDQALRTQVVERLILRNLQMQMAERAGYQVSDLQLQQAIERIAQQQNIGVEQLRKEVIASGLSYQDFREDVRTEMITGEVRRGAVSRRIYVSPQEIDSLVTMLKERGRKDDEYHLGHILIGLPSGATAKEIEDSKARGEKVIALLKKGSDFKKVAIAASSGEKALDGGDLGWMNINEMPTLFSEAVEGVDKNEIIGPIRSGAGFHILTIFDVRGREVVEVNEVNSRHILIQPSIILSDVKAKEMLEGFLADIKAGKADFAELAKLHSADPGSAARGGELGWSDPKIFVPEFRDTLNGLEAGQYGGPFKTSHGWHIVQVIEKRTQDATDKLQEDRAYQMLFKRKFNEESEAWLRQIREDAYVEVLE